MGQGPMLYPLVCTMTSTTGGTAMTVKAPWRVALPPAGFVAVMFHGPGRAFVRSKVPLILFGETAVTWAAVMFIRPGRVRFTTVVLMNPVPDRFVIVTDVVFTPDEGVMPVRPRMP